MDSSEVQVKKEIKDEVPIQNGIKSLSAYCALCQVLLRVGALDDHLNGKKHNWKLKDQEKSKVPKMKSTNFIITDPTQMPFYCAICQVSCGSKNEHVKYLAGKLWLWSFQLHKIKIC